MLRLSMLFVLSICCHVSAFASDAIVAYVEATDTTISNVSPTTSYFYDRVLIAGANGAAEKRFLYQFTLSAQPKRVERAYLRLAPLVTVAPTKVTPLDIYIIDKPGFNKYTNWSNQPPVFYRRRINIPAVTEENWYWINIDITGIYRNWQNKVWGDYGLMFVPVDRDNTLDGFASVNHSIVYPPQLRLIYFDFKFPLAGGYRYSKVSGYHFGDHWEGRHALDGVTKLKHTGTDFAAVAGDRVYACAAGYLKEAVVNSTWGGWVVIQHPNFLRSVESRATEGICTTTYMHVIPAANILEALAAGRRDIWIYKGGYIGNIAPGNANFKPHLHFQLRNDRYHSTLSRLGRLPAVSATTPASPRLPEPAWPEKFINPELAINWDYGNFD